MAEQHTPSPPTEVDDFFAQAEVRRAPRHHPVAARVFAGLAVGLFAGGGLWGAGQVAYGLNRMDATSGTPQALQGAEETYYTAHSKYTTDLSQLQTSAGRKFTTAPGVSAEILGVCDSGWVAQVSGEFSGARTYVASTPGSAGVETATSLATLKLPDCITADDLKTKGVTLTGDANEQVTVRTVKIERSSIDANGQTNSEVARVSWTAADTCAKGEKVTYEVTSQEQRPEAKADGVYAIDGELDLRTFDTAKKAVKIDRVRNGATYAVAVRGSCTGEFTAATPLAKSYTQSLPKPNLRVSSASGKLFPIVWGSSYPYVRYDIQYRRAYASGWTTLKNDYISGTALSAGGYSPNYGDQFRARTQTLDGKQTSDWGPATTLTYSQGYSSYGQGYYYGR